MFTFTLSVSKIKPKTMHVFHCVYLSNNNASKKGRNVYNCLIFCTCIFALVVVFIYKSSNNATVTQYCPS